MGRKESHVGVGKEAQEALELHPQKKESTSRGPEQVSTQFPCLLQPSHQTGHNHCEKESNQNEYSREKGLQKICVREI
jgi:hypothetical protein